MLDGTFGRFLRHRFVGGAGPWWCEFHTVVGSDHGVDSREREDEAIAVTVSWLSRQYGGWCAGAGVRAVPRATVRVAPSAVIGEGCVFGCVKDVALRHGGPAPPAQRG